MLFRSVLNTNLRGAFQCMQAFQRAMLKQRAGRIINISSVIGLIGNAGQANYAAGKAGIVGVTKAMAREWGRYKVNVNAVGFGYIVTRMTQAVEGGSARLDVGGRQLPAGIPKQDVQRLEATIPLGRGGTPEEAAGAVFLLCCPEADYITGQVLMVTGGM